MIDLIRNNEPPIDPTADMTQLEATQAMALAYALPVDTCECGDKECLGSAEIAGAIAASLAATLPQLESPMLKLIKERNEARKLCALVVDALPDLTHCFSSDKAMRAALEQIHVATITFLKASKQWDKRSYKAEGAE